MVVDVQDVVTATKGIQDLDLAHLAFAVTLTSVWLLRFLHNPHLASGWRVGRCALHRVADTVDLRKLALAAVKLFDLKEAGADGLIDVILGQTDRNGTFVLSEKDGVVTGCCRCGWREGAYAAVEVHRTTPVTCEGQPALLCGLDGRIHARGNR